MQIIRDLVGLRDAVAALRAEGKRIALVPTMGALHAGHIALVEEGLRRADAVIASIFVNPRQFGAGEDLTRYPRRERADAQMLETAGCAILWAPTVEAMYPAGLFDQCLGLGRVRGARGRIAAGAFRRRRDRGAQAAQPGRAPTSPCSARRTGSSSRWSGGWRLDLDLPVEIAGVPIVRDDHGLALSSRNAYLSEDEIAAARTLPRALGEAAAAIGRGEATGAALAAATARLADAGFTDIDYVTLRDAVTLAPIDALGEAPARLLAAARMGPARLIDNLAVAVATKV